MLIRKVFIGTAIVVTLLTLSSPPALAQTNNRTGDPVEQKVRVEDKREETPTPGAETAGDVAQLKARVGDLQALVELQQKTLNALQKRLDDLEGKNLTPSPLAPSSPLKTGTTAGESQEPSRVGEVAASQTSKPQDKDKDRVKFVGVAGWDNTSAFIRSASGDFETRVTGFAQLDFRGYQSGDHPPNTYAIRRARMRTDVKIHRYFEARIEAELADTTGILLRDFYLRIHRTEPFQITFGQVREPFSQEELRPEPNQDFVERSLTSLLVPGRSPGFMVSGVIHKGAFEYYLGSFNGKGPLRENNVGTPESVLRLRFAPWRNGTDFWLKGLAFGGAYAQGESQGGTSLRGQTTSRSFIFFTPDSVNGKVVRANGEMTWMLGPAAFRAEYDQLNQARDNLGPAGGNLPGVVAKAYVAQFTYLITGESKPESGVTVPRRNLFSREGGEPGFGAWELKARYDRLQISDATAKSNRASSFFFGVNWYLNRFVRYVLDLGFEQFKDPLRSPRPGDKHFFSTLSRMQITF